MHATIVVAHPIHQSLTQEMARRVSEGIVAADAGHSAEIVDLMVEGFDPRFTARDIAVLAEEAAPSQDVLAEQARLDRSDALVLVYPVYWWSMPALLKGWIDRVFVNGWAYDYSPKKGLVKKLGRLPIHLIAIGAADRGTYDRHGYTDAMKVQIDHGIFNYCGAPVLTSELLHLPDTGAPLALLDRTEAIGRGVFGERLAECA
ncbi:NAD(P)H-dependent oxidoreductase [Pleomorphomonas oryzae]|uniref:NAD(P)H-dependent oxidoreductase n=1 Tax=Pleomorphomonas oryzae TaxID=261934 RepID=UPI0004208D28|nr:NAD(P)H-dependent oxidoreductase [Pleomorphomonas oryzae]